MASYADLVAEYLNKVKCAKVGDIIKYVMKVKGIDKYDTAKDRVKPVLRRLMKKGLVYRDEEGRYCAKTTIVVDKKYSQECSNKPSVVPPAEITTSFGATVKLVASNMPLIGDGDPRRLPLLAVKVSTGKAVEKGVEHYLTADWKEGWSDWLKNAKDEFPSVLEHAVLTFHVDGCSRVCSHQFVRHRLVSFTQESQRYAEERLLSAVKQLPTYSEDEWDNIYEASAAAVVDLMEAEEDEELHKLVNRVSVIPPTVKRSEDTLYEYVYSVADALADYFNLRAMGVPMEDARYVLPQSVRTSLLATANLREWLHIINLRTHPKAQWEIREIAQAIKEIVCSIFYLC